MLDNKGAIMKFRFRLVEDKESVKAAKKDIVKEINKVYKKNPEKMEWAKRVAKCVDKVDDDKISNLVDAIKEECGDTKLTEEQSNKIVEASGKKDKLEGYNTLAKIFDFIDMSQLAKEKSKVAKAILAIALGFIPYVGPVLSILVQFVPDDVLAAIFNVGKYFDPIHWASASVDKKLAKAEK